MRIIITIALLCFCSAVQAQINLKKLKKAIGGELSLTTEEVAAGLKEALTKGVSTGSELVSQLDGYYKNPEIMIPFPPEVKQVEKRLRQMGLDDQVDKFILSLNRAAEDAAKESKPIFVSAIKNMTVKDAMSILKGEDDAATKYLKGTTSVELNAKFNPVIKQSLEKVNATRYYSDLVKTYNKIPFVEKVNPELDQYATEKAIEGLFVMIAKEEKNIRENPLARTSTLLKKVFGSQ
ncbi:MAG TPA: DUF4197 domain-containing protein [Ohtaekwangia sp.]|nr:DUF4197 domain-containing protein [Ohtaekwangia sp.]